MLESLLTCTFWLLPAVALQRLCTATVDSYNHNLKVGQGKTRSNGFIHQSSTALTFMLLLLPF